ncbi:outer membrane beta-barrel protein [Flammeovirga aprica]|uniref:Porin family protein n=1 Tax=Flammeovirga aprica JL-4 TaxID=694437 RepID=A0A7X9P1J0_9BACT|nr:outer membrane beta-barrel protein [Flammeovirga aprica]NME67735.1 porin family protein [Flammeovirga aprica JL-4]
MKKSILVLLLALASIVSANAQDKKFTIGIGAGASFMSAKTTFLGQETKSNGTGFNFLGNFYYNINPKISVGVEFASAAAILKSDGDSDNTEATGIGNYSLKGKYHFGENKVRPHVGLGLGMYNVIPVSAFDTKSTFGLAPEVGMNLGFFQLAAVYHIIPAVKYGEGESELKFAPSNFEIRAIFNINFASR